MTLFVPYCTAFSNSLLRVFGVFSLGNLHVILTAPQRASTNYFLFTLRRFGLMVSPSTYLIYGDHRKL